MMKDIMKKLYKKDSKGNIRFWSVTTEGADIIQHSGIVNTDSPVEHRKTATTKNVGRSNETTPEEQAQSEAESAYEKKKDKGYFDSIEKAENRLVIKPMLAKKYEDHAKKISWEKTTDYVHIQPKLDGMRCLAIIENGQVELMSRGGKPIPTMGHIQKELLNIGEEMFDSDEPYILDGELYAHGVSFQENMKLIKKYRKGQSENVVFNVYDTVMDKAYHYRYSDLYNIFHNIVFTRCKLIDSHLCYGEKYMKQFHEKFLVEGYEGTMIRYGKAGYKMGGRSANLLKYKEFQDIAVPIIDIIPQNARPEHGLVVCKTEAGEFKATPKMSHENRKRLLTNKDEYIGKIAEIRFFEYTDDGIPRFPVFIGLRDDK